MLNYFVELVGTFIFLSVIFHVGKPIPIAVALLAAILFGGSVSGGHFNPAVSITAWTRGALSTPDLLLYIIAQVLGGLLASTYTNLASKTV